MGVKREIPLRDKGQLTTYNHSHSISICVPVLPASGSTGWCRVGQIMCGGCIMGEIPELRAPVSVIIDSKHACPLLQIQKLSVSEPAICSGGRDCIFQGFSPYKRPCIENLKCRAVSALLTDMQKYRRTVKNSLPTHLMGIERGTLGTRVSALPFI